MTEMKTTKSSMQVHTESSEMFFLDERRYQSKKFFYYSNNDGKKILRSFELYSSVLWIIFNIVGKVLELPFTDLWIKTTKF